MVGSLIRGRKLEACTYVLEPKDLLGETSERCAKIRAVFKAANGTSDELKIVWIEELDFLAAGKGS